MDSINTNPDIVNDSQLKQKAIAYLPKNLGEIDAQQQILRMITKVVPTVAPFIRQADAEIWTKVSSGKMPMGEAISRCAFHVDTIIETTPFQNQKLSSFAEKDLLAAWIALDYYAYVLKTEYSINILQLKKRISDVLRMAKTVPVEEIDMDVTQPVIPPLIPNDPKKDDPIIVSDIPGGNGNGNGNGNGDIIIPKETWLQHMKRKIQENRKKLVLLVVAIVVALAAVFFCSDVQQTKSAIRKIKDVTLDSEAQILHAEELYAALDEDQQKKVDNHEDLLSARTEYDSLVAEAAIEKIGTVTLESKDAIVNAEKIYNTLSKNSKNLVDNYKTLTAARKEYDRLDAAVKKAEKAIDAIGQVTLKSGNKITEARKAYDALKKDKLQNYLSGKVSTLTTAEETYKQLKSQDFYDTGLAHHADKKYEEAIKCFDTVIKDYSDTKVAESAHQAKADSQVALAEQSYTKKDYYTAVKTLESVEAKYQQQENYKKLQEKTMKAIEKARPRNGTLLEGKAKWGYCQFKITTKDKDVCFKFQDTKDPSKYKLVFVRAGESTKVNITDGHYSIKYATGKYWYGKDHLFGDDTQYFSKGTVDFETTYSGNWVHYWVYTLDMSKSDFLSYSIDANEF